uniref:aquaporin-like n=1 Tax=Ciona intestinalis TaxID=7719 RepID=UPI00089DCB6F|nr:aquaporin-like [Ciona intestinalis]|eukprot:XP_004226091.2 aquaporin-like [Ciona intestinalis]
MAEEKIEFETKPESVKFTRNYFRFAVPLMAEFVATFLHTFWGSMAGFPLDRSTNSLNSSIISSDVTIGYPDSNLLPAFQAGFAVWILIVGFFNISVFHFNPAVSVGFLVSGDLVIYMLIPYVVAQCLGAAAGAQIAKSLRGEDLVPLYIQDDANITAIFFCEFITTGFIMFFTLAMVVDKTYQQHTGPFALGMTVFQGVLAGRWVGAGCLNPARWFGPALVTGGAAWNYHWVLWLGDCVGAFVFAIIYMMFFAPEDRIWFLKLNKKVSNLKSPAPYSVTKL